MFVWFLSLLITYIGGRVLRLSLYKWKRWPALLVIILYVDWSVHEFFTKPESQIDTSSITTLWFWVKILSPVCTVGLVRASCFMFPSRLLLWEDTKLISFIMLFMCSVLSAAWYHCPVGVWPVVCRKQVHSVPPLTPKFPSSIAPHSTSSSSWLFVVSFIIPYKYYPRRLACSMTSGLPPWHTNHAFHSGSKREVLLLFFVFFASQFISASCLLVHFDI